MPLLVSKWCHRAAVRLASLPSDHPLYKAIDRKDVERIKWHRSPLNLLLASLDVRPSKVEKISATSRDLMSSSKLLSPVVACVACAARAISSSS